MHHEVEYCSVLAVAAFCVLVGAARFLFCQQVGGLESVILYFDRN